MSKCEWTALTPTTKVKDNKDGLVNFGIDLTKTNGKRMKILYI